jgi:hypothetical protein
LASWTQSATFLAENKVMALVSKKNANFFRRKLAKIVIITLAPVCSGKLAEINQSRKIEPEKLVFFFNWKRLL